MATGKKRHGNIVHAITPFNFFDVVIVTHLLVLERRINGWAQSRESLEFFRKREVQEVLMVWVMCGEGQEDLRQRGGQTETWTGVRDGAT